MLPLRVQPRRMFEMNVQAAYGGLMNENASSASEQAQRAFLVLFSRRKKNDTIQTTNLEFHLCGTKRTVKNLLLNNFHLRMEYLLTRSKFV